MKNDDTTFPPIVIGEVNGQPIILHEGKGENPSIIEFNGESCSQGYVDVVFGKVVNDVYSTW